jgi:trypsin
LLALVAALAAVPAAASAAPPRIEVGPGIYLAAASDFAQPQASVAPLAASAAPADRIAGGSKTQIRRWPWQVSIRYRPIDRHNCGGSLVAPKVVVTAAHCVTLGLNRNFQPAKDFEVVTGRTRLSSDRGRVHALADYYWFVDADGVPLWDPDTAAWDVVFMVLSSRADQRTIKIAGPGEEAVWAPGRRAFVTGWGTTSETSEKSSDVLRQGAIKMISDSACDDYYGPILHPDVMVCAGRPAGGVDACSGDSGGPLVVPVARGDFRLVGDTSFAEGCARPGVPGVYGRLASDPIRSALGNGIKAIAGDNVIGRNAVPSTDFAVVARTHRPRRGTGGLVLRVPGPGQVQLHYSAKNRGALVYPRAAGRVAVPVRPRFRIARRLAAGAPGEATRVRVHTRVSYQPLGGEERTKRVRIGLIQRNR